MVGDSLQKRTPCCLRSSQTSPRAEDCQAQHREPERVLCPRTPAPPIRADGARPPASTHTPVEMRDGGGKTQHPQSTSPGILAPRTPRRLGVLSGRGAQRRSEGAGRAAIGGIARVSIAFMLWACGKSGHVWHASAMSMLGGQAALPRARTGGLPTSSHLGAPRCARTS